MKRGKFIVFEGIDGSGKSTQVGRYVDYLHGRGIEAVAVREPSVGPIGMLLRSYLKGELALGSESRSKVLTLLFAADRLEHFGRDVERHLRLGVHVIGDRYTMSSLIYQANSHAWGFPPPSDWIEASNRYADEPDCYVILDIDLDVAMQRCEARPGRDIFENRELLEKVAAEYRVAGKYVHGVRGTDVIHVDGNGTLEEVTSRIVTALALEDES